MKVQVGARRQKRGKAPDLGDGQRRAETAQARVLALAMGPDGDPDCRPTTQSPRREKCEVLWGMHRLHFHLASWWH